jgi:HSP20 family protein
MALVEWSPFREAMPLRRLINQLFEDAVIAPGQTGAVQQNLDLALDIMERDHDLIVKASLPGVKPEDVHASVENNILTIAGEIRDEQEQKDGRYYCRERRYGRFARSVLLPSPVNADAAEARFEDGVLTITLPKTEEARPKRINLRTPAHAIEAPREQQAEAVS